MNYTFFIRACGAIVLLRLIIVHLFPDNYVYTKERLSDLVIAGSIFVLSLIWIFNQIRAQAKFPRTPFDLSIYLLVGALCLSLSSSVDASASVNFFIVTISYIALFYILAATLKDSKQILDVWSYMQISLVLVILFGFWEYFFLKDPVSGSVKRVGSIFQLPNVLAGFLMLLTPFLWATITLTKNQWKKRAFILLLCVCLGLFLLTFAFLCTLNFIITTLILTPLIFKQWSNKPENRKYFFGIIVATLAFCILILLLRKDFSLGARWDYLRCTFLVLKDHPWIGSGLDTFSLVSKKYITYLFGYSAYVHNSYLQLWIETGVLGFLAGLCMVGLFIKESLFALRKENEYSRRIVLIAFIWSLSFFFIDNLSNFTLLRPNVSLFFWIVLAGFGAFINSYKINQESLKSTKRDQWIFGFLAILIISLLILGTRISLALLDYNKGMVFFSSGKITQSEVYFEKARLLDPTEFRYPSALGSLNIRKYFIAKDTSFLKQAEQDFLEAARLSPLSHKTYFILSNISKELGDSKKSQEYLQQAKDISPLTYSH